MHHDDFLLHLAGDGPERFAVRVLRSPAGEASARSLPLPDSDGWDDLAAELEHLTERERAVREVGLPRRDLTATSLSTPALAVTLKELGERLFATLFPPTIRDRLRESVGQVGVRADRGLRLRLQVDACDPMGARLHSLPWEFLFDQGFLGLRRATPIVRSLDLAGPRRPLELAPPLRVLAVLAEPRDLPPLKLREEQATLAATWEAQGGVDVEWLGEPTLEGLCRELMRRPVQVLHFLGHGGFDPVRAEGMLHFAGQDGNSQPVAASTLAIQLADFSTLRLVFLNACQTARTAVQAPFAGVATALLRTGVPAVLAMQLPIPDGAAIAFSTTVYRRLAAGDTIDRAVTAGRLALHRRDPESIAWGIPVLYLRSQEAEQVRSAIESAVPMVARSNRRPRAKFVALAVGGATAVAITGWLATLGGLGGPPPKTIRSSEEPEPERTTDQMVKPAGEAHGLLIQPPAPADPVGGDEGELQPQSVEGGTEPEPEIKEPLVPTPQMSSTIDLRDGEITPIPGVAAIATAEFLTQFGHPFVRLTISPEGVAPMFRAVLGPDTLEVSSPEGRIVVNVLSINWTAKSLTVKGRLLPAGR